MQFSNSVPIYLQVMEDMKREMVTGGLPAGSRVDSVRVLAARSDGDFREAMLSELLPHAFGPESLE